MESGGSDLNEVILCSTIPSSLIFVLVSIVSISDKLNLI